MPFVSILMPAWKFPNIERFSSFLKENFPQNEDQIEYYEIVPIVKEKIGQSTKVCVKFRSSDFTMTNMEKLIQENKQLHAQLDRTKETIQNLSQEFSKMSSNSALEKDIDQQKSLKRIKQIKQLEEDNKKLRQLLRTQLESSEKLREETQTTVETLKEEFELLVRELAGLKKRNTEFNQTGGFGSTERGNGFFASIKPNEIIPKIDKIETLFNNHQSFSIRLDEDVSKPSYK